MQYKYCSISISCEVLEFFESAAYVARYVMKKVVCSRDDLDRLIMKDTGEILKPEYVTMSRRPGIGSEWFSRFCNDVYPHDFCLSRGVKCKPPRYYDNRLELSNPKLHGIIKANRFAVSRNNPDNTPRRLAVREAVKLKAVERLGRVYETSGI